MDASEALEAIFAAERSLRQHETVLLARPHGALADVLHSAVNVAFTLPDAAERSLRLERLADLCAQVSGPVAVQALLSILDAETPAIRVAAGEALLDVAYERFAEVARGIEQCLAEGWQGPAMEELPFLLAELGEPGALKLLRRFLTHTEADVVAAAIEASVELGDPQLIPALGDLSHDARLVELEGEEAPVTLGDLATQAMAELADP